MDGWALYGGVLCWVVMILLVAGAFRFCFCPNSSLLERNWMRDMEDYGMAVFASD